MGTEAKGRPFACALGGRLAPARSSRWAATVLVGDLGGPGGGGGADGFASVAKPS